MGLRIVLTSVHAWPGVHRGAERYVHELSSALQDAGHDVRVLATGAPRRDLQLGVPVRRLTPRGPARHGARGREGVFGLQALVLEGLRRTDVWHATSTGDGAAAAAAGRLRPGLRTVFTDHGFPVRRSREQRGDAGLHARVVGGVDHYVCVSAAAGAYLQSEYGRTADVVPPGVDTAVFRPGPGRASRPVVLYSGDLAESRKGVRTLVEAVARLEGVTLRLAGPGTPDLSGLPTAHVEVLGLVDLAELPRLYREAWVTALPSVAESFGMALSESLACGTPGVARRDGGGPVEVLDEATGVLCGAGVPELTHALAQALTMTPAAADACRERARRWDWRTAVVPALERLYAA
ncbi:MAG: mshA1 [Frankiales bacterium]|nr:mshA1 [Frankiales bacterium]